MTQTAHGTTYFDEQVGPLAATVLTYPNLGEVNRRGH